MAATTPIATATNPSLYSRFSDTVTSKYGKYITWISANSVDLNKRLSSTGQDSLVKRVAKVFFTFIASIALIIPSLAVSGASKARDFFCPAGKTNPSAPVPSA